MEIRESPSCHGRHDSLWSHGGNGGEFRIVVGISFGERKIHSVVHGIAAYPDLGISRQPRSVAPTDAAVCLQ